jgi:hypothetical protein
MTTDYLLPSLSRESTAYYLLYVIRSSLSSGTAYYLLSSTVFYLARQHYNRLSAALHSIWRYWTTNDYLLRSTLSGEITADSVTFYSDRRYYIGLYASLYSVWGDCS